MVGKVLTGNGITRCEKGSYGLVGGDELSDAERDQLLQLCRQRLDAWRPRHKLINRPYTDKVAISLFNLTPRSMDPTRNPCAL
jgi:hypothetical protein